MLFVFIWSLYLDIKFFPNERFVIDIAIVPHYLIFATLKGFYLIKMYVITWIVTSKRM